MPKPSTCLAIAVIALQVLTLYTLIRLVAAIETFATVLAIRR